MKGPGSTRGLQRRVEGNDGAYNGQRLALLLRGDTCGTPATPAPSPTPLRPAAAACTAVSHHLSVLHFKKDDKRATSSCFEILRSTGHGACLADVSSTCGPYGGPETSDREERTRPSRGHGVCLFSRRPSPDVRPFGQSLAVTAWLQSRWRGAAGAAQSGRRRLQALPLPLGYALFMLMPLSFLP